MTATGGAPSGGAPKRILVTGATGFVGSALLDTLLERTATPVRALVRDPGHPLPDRVEPAAGDLLAPPSLEQALEGVDVVIHAAAATGTASAATMERVNRDGTRHLAEACVRAGVRRLIHVSTIAVNYPNLDSYPYAASKRASEEVVVASGIPAVIVRPTVVLGPGSPAAASFRTLAGGPALLLPGPGAARVQSVDVRDVAQVLAGLAWSSALPEEPVEVGGAEAPTMRETLKTVRRMLGKGEGPVVRLPLFAMGFGARIAEALLGARAPLTPGQLSVFRWDSVARPNAALEDVLPEPRGLEEMLADDPGMGVADKLEPR